MPIGRTTARNGRRPLPVGLVSTPWTPSALGASLVGWWDAERMAAGDVVGGLATSWTDSVAAYKPVQAVTASQPAYSPTAFNGRPALVFDGTDDALSLETVPFFTGASQFEVWFLAGQSRPATDIAVSRAFCFGGGTGATAFRLGSVNLGGNKRVADARVVQDSTTDYIGPSVVRVVTTTTTVAMTVNNGAPTTATVATNIGTTRLRIGATDNATPDGFWQGPISAVIVTSLLSAPQAAAMAAWLQARAGV